MGVGIVGPNPKGLGIVNNNIIVVKATFNIVTILLALFTILLNESNFLSLLIIIANVEFLITLA